MNQIKSFRKFLKNKDALFKTKKEIKDINKTIQENIVFKKEFFMSFCGSVIFSLIFFLPFYFGFIEIVKEYFILQVLFFCFGIADFVSVGVFLMCLMELLLKQSSFNNTLEDKLKKLEDKSKHIEKEYLNYKENINIKIVKDLASYSESLSKTEFKELTSIAETFNLKKDKTRKEIIYEIINEDENTIENY